MVLKVHIWTFPGNIKMVMAYGSRVGKGKATERSKFMGGWELKILHEKIATSFQLEG